MTHTFSFELDTEHMNHIEEKSWYDHNYYELDLTQYGDYIIPGICNILFEEYDEFADTYTYTLGYFEYEKFVNCFTWTEMHCKTTDFIS